jgi:hypothetical protein
VTSNKKSNVPNKIQLNPLQVFLIWSSGADREVLSQASCLTERYKYESIGATVILTAIMAFFSGGYALFTVFGSVPISIILGTIWSSIIFNLDRYFILTAHQGKSSSSYNFYLASILRLSIAILLSFVVAKPLELRLFEGEINQEIILQKKERDREERKKEQAELENAPESKRIVQINQQIKYLTTERSKRVDSLEKARSNVIEEEEGIGRTGKPGQGSIYKEKKMLQQKLEQEINYLDDSLKKLDNEKRNLTERQELRLRKSISSTNKSQQPELEWQAGSLLDRLSALEKLSKRDTTVAMTNNLITFLFIIIEISPVLVKLLSKEGMYEEIIEKENIYRTRREDICKIKEKEIFKIEELKDFELRVEALVIEYIRVKERNKEKIENTGIYDIKSILREYDQEIAMFQKICKERIAHYESNVSE